MAATTRVARLSNLFSTAQLCLLVLCVVVPLVASSPVPDSSSLLPRQATIGGSDIPDVLALGTCQSDRSDDYYGLGVRLGNYLNWISAWIAFNFVPTEIGSNLTLNTVYLFAVVLAMVRCTITGLILQIDGLILMHLGAGTVFSVISIWGYRTSWYIRQGPSHGISHFGGFGTHMRLLLCIGFGSYGLFFWLNGVHGNPPAMGAMPNESEGVDCSILYTWMFAKVRADGGVRIYYIFICLACLVYWGIMLIASSLAVYKRVDKMSGLARRGEWGTSIKLKFATGLSYKQLRFAYYFFSMGTFVWIIIAITMVEYSLIYNHMRQVLGWRGRLFFPAQLIPLIIGICQFFTTCYAGIQQWRSNGEHEPSAVVEEPSTPLTMARRTPKPSGVDAFKVFSPQTVKTNSSGLYNTRQLHKDTEMDPLLLNQPVWLRCLVTWLPWLVLVQWWTPYDKDVYAPATIEVDPFTRKRTKKEKERSNRDTWISDGTWTAVNSPREKTDDDDNHISSSR